MEVINQISTNSYTLGGNIIASATVAQTAGFFDLLASGLYSDKELAVVREIITNAWDSHIESNIDIPVNIKIDNKRLVIRDFGKGISHEKMAHIYLAYGISDKVSNAQQTGGFGLGCKSPFALVDNFEVISRFKGIANHYIISKNYLNGIPEINHIYSIPTEESGVSVSFDTDNLDVDYLIWKAILVCKYGGIKAEINDKNAEIIEFDDEFKYVDYPHGYNDSVIIRYGNNFYTVDLDKIFKYNDKELKILSKIHIINKTYTLMVKIKPGSIYVTPSRESISYDPITINNLKKILSNISKKLEMTQGKYDRIARKFYSRAYDIENIDDFEILHFLNNNKFKSSLEKKFIKRFSAFDHRIFNTNNHKLVKNPNNRKIHANLRNAPVNPQFVIISKSFACPNNIKIRNKFNSYKNSNVLLIKYNKREREELIYILNRYNINFLEYEERRRIRVKEDIKYIVTDRNGYSININELEGKGEPIIITTPGERRGIISEDLVDRNDIYTISTKEYNSKKWEDIVKKYEYNKDVIIKNKLKELESTEFSYFKYMISILEYGDKYSWCGYHYNDDLKNWAYQIFKMAMEFPEFSLKLFGEEISDDIDNEKFSNILTIKNIKIFGKYVYNDISCVKLKSSKMIKNFLLSINENHDIKHIIEILNVMEKMENENIINN